VLLEPLDGRVERDREEGGDRDHGQTRAREEDELDRSRHPDGEAQHEEHRARAERDHAFRGAGP
jgi:hypothetical protein